MMSKYQLVFVKLESALLKITNSQQIRDRGAMQEALYRIRGQALERTSQIGYRTEMVFLKVREKGVRKIVETWERKGLKQINYAFTQWKNATKLPGVVNAIEEGNRREIGALQSK